MAEIKRVAPGVHKRVDKELERLRIEELFRYENIFKVLAKSKTLTVEDFHDFFLSRYKAFKSDLVQEAEIKVMEGSYHEPDISQFHFHQRAMALTSEEGELFVDGMLGWIEGGGKFKAARAADAGATRPDGMPMTPEELEEMARGTLGEWEQFMSDAWGEILDHQMMMDYRARMDEINKEVKRILMLARRGIVGAEFALIAMLKVNATKNGVLMTWLGKKAFHVNESLSRVANDLVALSPEDPRYFSEMQLSREKTRDGSFQLNLLVSDMQKVMQDVASVMEQVHGMIGEINRTRREIIMKINPPAG